MTEVAENFAGVKADGPFGYKPDRDQPIEPHFDRFSDLSPTDRALVLQVRDGLLNECILKLDSEVILVEHAGIGYFDHATQRRWGYTVRRIPRPSISTPTPTPRDTPSTSLSTSPKPHSSSAQLTAPSTSPSPTPSMVPHATPAISVGTPSASASASRVFTERPVFRDDSDQTATLRVNASSDLSDSKVGTVFEADRASQDEMSSLRLERDTLEERGKRLQADILELRKQFRLFEQERANNDHLLKSAQAELARLQADRVRLEDEKRRLNGELARARLKGADPAQGKGLKANPLQALDASWEQEELAREREELQEKTRLILEKERAIQQKELEIQAEDEKIKLKSLKLESEFKHLKKQQPRSEVDVWVPPARRAQESGVSSENEDRAVFVRVCLAFFVTLVLLGQCISYAREAFGAWPQ